MQTLRKCLEELDKAEPRLEYIRGMIETLIEITEVFPNALAYSPKKKVEEINTLFPVNEILKPLPSEPSEGDILDARTKARVAEIKRLSEVSSEDA